MDNVGALASEPDRLRVDRDDDLAIAARSNPVAFGLDGDLHVAWHQRRSEFQPAGSMDDRVRRALNG